MAWEESPEETGKPSRHKAFDTSHGEFEPRVLSSDDAPADVAFRRRRKWFCTLLKRWANFSIGLSAVGIPWTLYDMDGYGTPVTFGGLAGYLFAMGWRARILLERH
jgi:hypothetical protein